MFHKNAFWGATVLATLLAFGATAIAQTEVSTSRFEIGVSYSGLHVNSADGDDQRTGNGGSGSFEYNLNKVVSLAADFCG